MSPYPGSHAVALPVSIQSLRGGKTSSRAVMSTGVEEEEEEGGSRQDKGELEAVFPHPWVSSVLQPWKTPWFEDSNPVGERETFQCYYLFLLPFPTVC